MAVLKTINPFCRMFYGPRGPYALYAGKDASRALAKMLFEEKDITGDISGLGSFDLEALQDWEYKFMSQYVKVGAIKKTLPEANDQDATKPTEDGPSESAPSETHSSVKAREDLTDKHAE